MAGRCPWQPFHSLTLHIDRVDTKDWHYFKLLAGTCVCGATSTSVTCNSSHFWHSELKIMTQSWKTLGTWRCPQHKPDQQSPSGESLSTASARQYEAAMRNAMQCYAMLCNARALPNCQGLSLSNGCQGLRHASLCLNDLIGWWITPDTFNRMLHLQIRSCWQSKWETWGAKEVSRGDSSFG